MSIARASYALTVNELSLQCATSGNITSVSNSGQVGFYCTESGNGFTSSVFHQYILSSSSTLDLNTYSIAYYYNEVTGAPVVGADGSYVYRTSSDTKTHVRLAGQSSDTLINTTFTADRVIPQYFGVDATGNVSIFASTPDSSGVFTSQDFFTYNVNATTTDICKYPSPTATVRSSSNGKIFLSGISTLGAYIAYRCGLPTDANPQLILKSSKDIARDYISSGSTGVMVGYRNSVAPSSIGNRTARYWTIDAAGKLKSHALVNLANGSKKTYYRCSVERIFASGNTAIGYCLGGRIGARLVQWKLKENSKGTIVGGTALNAALAKVTTQKNEPTLVMSGDRHQAAIYIPNSKKVFTIHD